MPDDDAKYVKASRLARDLGVDVRTVHAWIERGAIKGTIMVPTLANGKAGNRQFYTTRGECRRLVDNWIP